MSEETQNEIQAPATAERKFRTIGPEMWKPQKAGESVEGQYVDKKENQGTESNSTIYTLEKDGKRTMVWGSVILNERMAVARIGEYVRLTFNGKKSIAGGHSVNLFTVEVEEA